VSQLQRKPTNVWRTVKAVAWSFFGVRKGSDYEQDIQNLNPFTLIAVGIASCFAFVVGLMMFVKWVVAP
jgi:organic hydroperoxide reductase OsmC/OhrA